jgi:hypothetical protein
MRPKIHIFIGIIFIVFLNFIFPSINFLNLSVIFFSNWLIDFDHYIYYFIQKKDLNLSRCYKWYDKDLKETLVLPMKERKKRYTGFYIFHGIEFLIFLFLLGLSVSPFFIFVFIGALLHFIIDIIHEYYIKRTLHKISLIYSYIQWKKLEKRNLDFKKN